MPATEETFQELVAQLDYPMFIATVAAGDELAGCLIGFATQCSIHPPRFLAASRTRTAPSAWPAAPTPWPSTWSRRTPTELAELFGGETGDEVDKFERCEWQPGPGGVPLLDDCPNRFVGRILERVDFGDHVGLVLEPFMAEADTSDGQLSFHRAKRIDPGHEA